MRMPHGRPAIRTGWATAPESERCSEQNEAMTRERSDPHGREQYNGKQATCSNHPEQGSEGIEYDKRKRRLDRELYLGNRQRRAARPLRPRQVPRRHPPDDGAAPAGRGPGGHQAGSPRHEGLPRHGGRRRPGPRTATGRRPGVLQHLEVHATRPESPREPAAAHGPTSIAYLDGFSPNVQDILDNFEFQQSDLRDCRRPTRSGHSSRGSRRRTST